MQLFQRKAPANVMHSSINAVLLMSLNRFSRQQITFFYITLIHQRINATELITSNAFCETFMAEPLRIDWICDERSYVFHFQLYLMNSTRNIIETTFLRRFQGIQYFTYNLLIKQSLQQISQLQQAAFQLCRIACEHSSSLSAIC